MNTHLYFSSFVYQKDYFSIFTKFYINYVVFEHPNAISQHAIKQHRFAEGAVKNYPLDLIILGAV